METVEARPDPRFAWFERAAFWVAMVSCIVLLLFTLAQRHIIRAFTFTSLK